ncbi:hypothetical protein [Paraburkholderia fungorum]|uniref:Uncharacterized protein n=1 Tax=Paraburkholderia fungorum TaxID=134537 RepID=A0A3R7L6Q6_9BURK|nr:hypothetical protein [Paraburkholderia fungorum]RKF31433.1 hypothetical protein BCY88_11690 [Paraburkholderia fungorum]
MTRISQPSQAEAANLAHAHETGRAGNEQDVARHAALYRGTTRFAYTPKPQPGARGSLRNRKLAELQARRRRAALRRTRMNGSGGVDDDGDGEGGAHEESRRVTRDGGGGGGRGGGDQGGQSHDGQHDSEGALPLNVRVRAGASEPAPMPGALQTLAATCSNDAERADAVRGGLCDGLLDVRDNMAKHPDAEFDARLYELMADARAALRHAPFKPGNPAGLRQLMIDRSGNRQALSMEPAHAVDTRLATTAPVSPDHSVPGTPQPQLNRVQRLNLLEYLFLLSAESPMPPSQRDGSVNRLSLLRAGALARGKGHR